MKDIKDVCCPDCGAKDFEDLGLSTTLLGWIPRYVNGKLVSKNPNHTTTGFKCYKCGKIWYETDVIFIASDINEVGEVKAVSPSSSVCCEDTLHEASLEAIEALKAENADLRERLEKTIELPFFQKDGEAIVLIYKNKDGVVLTETYFEDVYYGEKRGDDVAEARLAELKGENK